jgi:hypothetical protein
MLATLISKPMDLDCLSIYLKLYFPSAVVSFSVYTSCEIYFSVIVLDALMNGIELLVSF